MHARLLLIDDDAEQIEAFGAFLSGEGYDVSSCTSPLEGLERLQREDFDAVLTDLEMPGMSGIELCTRVTSLRPGLPVIVVTGCGNMEKAIEAIRAGAYDFITKPVDEKLVTLSIKRGVRSRHLEGEVRRLRECLAETGEDRQLVGASAPMARVRELIARVGAMDISVLVQGETGTGKELVARALHATSGRKGPFVAVNCAAVPAALLESELFGHVRGAFTDARSARAGLFVQASGGTLLLDEIGEMPLDMQAKLLRALQERTVRPVGGNAEVPFDARVVAATHRDLEIEVEAKRFREDLFYRLHVVKIEVPALRERGADILAIATRFLKVNAARLRRPELGISPPAAALLLAYHWPGNVRELQNCLERATALARSEFVVEEDLPEKIRAYRPNREVLSIESPSEILSLEELERRYIFRAIALLGGNKSRAAELLGLDRRTLYRRLDRYSEGNRGSGEAAAIATDSQEEDIAV